MSRHSRKTQSLVDDAASIRPAMADLRIAPIRSSADYRDHSRSSISASTVLPPLRTLEPQARYNSSSRPAALEPPRDVQHSSYSSSTFQQPRRSTHSSRSAHHHHHQQQQQQRQQQQQQQRSSSSRHRSRTGESASSSSSAPSSTTSPRHSILDSRQQSHAYTYERADDDGSSPQSHDHGWRERPTTASSTYSPEQGPYPTPVRSTAGCSDMSSESYSSPPFLMHSPVTSLSRATSAGWTLQIRQQPRAARACGFGERDRRVIDPPPMVQLESTDTRNRPLDTSEVLGMFTIVHVSLWNEAGTADCTALVQPGRRPGGRLMGTLVASATIALDETNEEGVFYAFPDLSCRSYGNYRLRFALMSIDPLNGQPGATSPIIAHAMSDVFTVYSAKDFPGMRPSTALTQALKRQGTAIPVKKGKHSSSSRGERDEADDEDDDDDD